MSRSWTYRKHRIIHLIRWIRLSRAYFYKTHRISSRGYVFLASCSFSTFSSRVESHCCIFSQPIYAPDNTVPHNRTHSPWLTCDPEQNLHSFSWNQINLTLEIVQFLRTDEARACCAVKICQLLIDRGWAPTFIDFFDSCGVTKRWNGSSVGIDSWFPIGAH